MPTFNNFNELDYDVTKEKIISFLETRTEFQDFKFTGAALNLLLDPLAYTTNYIGAYANMAISEAIFDSAQLRESVVSGAKTLDYFPRQMSSPSAQITLSIQDPEGTPESVVVPLGTRFSCVIDGVPFTFITLDEYFLTNDGNGLYSSTVEISEGSLVSQSWTFRDNGQRFIFEQSNIDDAFFNVTIRPNSGSTTINNWSRASDLFSIRRDSEVYFIQEVSDNRVEVYFGDGVLGAKPTAGNIIEVQTITTKGADSNGARVFQLTDNISGLNSEDFRIAVIAGASGGSSQQSIDEIKHNAPRAYQAQDRAVIPSDYDVAIRAQYGFIETMSVWGGEDNIPPQYGRVFISIKPNFGNIVPNFLKSDIVEFLNRKNVVGTLPILVDPVFIRVNTTNTIKYFKSRTSLSEGQLKNNINTAITEFFSGITQFDAAFYDSKFGTALDNVDSSIISSSTVTTISQIITPPAYSARTFSVVMNNGIKADTIVTNMFRDVRNNREYQLRDNGNGRLNYFENGVLVQSEIGSIDYVNGRISITNFIFPVDGNTPVEFFAEPADVDIFTVRNSLILKGTTTVELDNRDFRQEDQR